MFDSDASDIVEHGGQFVALRCFQYCQLVVWLTYSSHTLTQPLADCSTYSIGCEYI